MKTFLIIYEIICILSWLFLAYEIKHAIEVPQDKDIFEL